MTGNYLKVQDSARARAQRMGARAGSTSHARRRAAARLISSDLRRSADRRRRGCRGRGSCGPTRGRRGRRGSSRSDRSPRPTAARTECPARGVQRNQVHLRLHAGQQLRERPRVLRRVVHAGEQHVFERDPAAFLQRELPARLDNRSDPKFLSARRVNRDADALPAVFHAKQRSGQNAAEAQILPTLRRFKKTVRLGRSEEIDDRFDANGDGLRERLFQVQANLAGDFAATRGGAEGETFSQGKYWSGDFAFSRRTLVRLRESVEHRWQMRI